MTSLDDFSEDDVCEVTPRWLRKLFDECDILHRNVVGELGTEVVVESHPSPEKSHEPECTWSQILRYIDTDGNQIAQAHRYLRPDGTTGASGKPDPKFVLHEGTLYGCV